MKFYYLLVVAVVALLSKGQNSDGHHISPRSSHSDHEPNFASDFFQNVTSSAMSIDEWLFSEDLFSGHAIPQNLHYNEAIKMFAVLMEDKDVFSRAYEKYRIQYSKGNTDEMKLETKKFNFRENLHFIFNHNLKADSGQFRFQLGVNNFADMTFEEMTQFLGGNDKLPIIHPKNDPNNPFLPPHFSPSSITPPITTTPFPLSFDLRDDKIISPIKNQKGCGSCVFFSHAALIEALYAAKNNGEIINASEQMMLDCAHKNYGYCNNNGCDGNIMEDTGRFLVEHGVTTEDLYKYKAEQGNCSKEGKNVVAKLKDYWQVEPSIEAFKSTLVTLKSPIAAAFYVYPQFMFYRTGVYDWCMPPNGATGGHAILIVGYGRFFDTEYWLVKNSWGVKWGERGYFKYVAGSNFCQFERWGFTGNLV